MNIWTVNRHRTQTDAASTAFRRCERVDLSAPGAGARAPANWNATIGRLRRLDRMSGWNVEAQATSLAILWAGILSAPPVPRHRRGLDLNWLLIPDVWPTKIAPDNHEHIVQIFERGRVEWWTVPAVRRRAGFHTSAAEQLAPIGRAVRDAGGVGLVWAEMIELPLNAESLKEETLKAVLSSDRAMALMPQAVRDGAALLTDPEGWQKDRHAFNLAKEAFANHAMTIVHQSALELLRTVGIADQDTRVVFPNAGGAAAAWATDNGLGTPTLPSTVIEGLAPCDYLLVGRPAETGRGRPKRAEALVLAVDKARAFSGRADACPKLNISDLTPAEAEALGTHIGPAVFNVIAWSDLPADDKPDSDWRPQAEVDAVLDALARGAARRGETLTWSDVKTPVGGGGTVRTGGIETDMRAVATAVTDQTVGA